MYNKVNLAFPGLGIEEFTINKVVFELPLLGEVRWYGLLITIGMVLAFIYAWYRGKQNEIKLDDILDMGLFAIIFGVIGARLYYVIMTVNEYNYDSFIDVIAIWNGGLAIYGGIIAGAITVFCVAKYKKLKFYLCADTILPGVMIAQALGRWGNFFNGEAYGGVVGKDSIFYFLRMGIYPNNISGVDGMAYVHPTFLYESLWNVIGFILINIFYKKKKFDGEIALWYVTWYGFGRMLIEGLRTDSLYVGPFRISQVIGFLCFIVGASIIVYIRIKAYLNNKKTRDIKES